MRKTKFTIQEILDTTELDTRNMHGEDIDCLVKNVDGITNRDLHKYWLDVETGVRFSTRANRNYDGRRGAVLGVLLVDEKSAAILARAGRELDDISHAVALNLDLCREAVRRWEQAILKDQKTVAVEAALTDVFPNIYWEKRPVVLGEDLYGYDDGDDGA